MSVMYVVLWYCDRTNCDTNTAHIFVILGVPLNYDILGCKKKGEKERV
jgi:hypothetical protein